MTWGGLNPALTAWRTGINARFPKRGLASDGARADQAHGSTSEHQEDPDGTVDAFDMDVNLLGSRNEAGTAEERALVDALKLDFEADGRGQLWIHQREIANRDIGNWTERHYDGQNAHDKHTHWQSRQAGERNGATWSFKHTDALLRRMEGEDVEPKDLLDYDDVPNPYGDVATNPKITVRSALKAAAQADATTRDTAAAVKTLRAELGEVKATLNLVLEKLTTATPEQPPAK